MAAAGPVYGHLALTYLSPCGSSVYREASLPCVCLTAGSQDRVIHEGPEQEIDPKTQWPDSSY